MGLIVGKGGRTIDEIRERSKVSSLTTPKNERGTFYGEIQLQAGCKEVKQATAIASAKKKKIWISAFLFGGIVYFVNIRHYANFQIYRPLNDTVHPT